MNISYENNIGLDTWDMIFPSMVMDSAEIRKASRDEINDAISIYVIGTGTLFSVSNSNDTYLSDELFIALKTWATKFNGKAVFNTKCFENIINEDMNVPLKILEACYIKENTNKPIPMYVMMDMDIDGRKEDDIIITTTDDVSIKYNINQPVIVITKDDPE